MYVVVPLLLLMLLLLLLRYNIPMYISLIIIMSHNGFLFDLHYPTLTRGLSFTSTKPQNHTSKPHITLRWKLFWNGPVRLRIISSLKFHLFVSLSYTTVDKTATEISLQVIRNHGKDNDVTVYFKTRDLPDRFTSKPGLETSQAFAGQDYVKPTATSIRFTKGEVSSLAHQLFVTDRICQKKKKTWLVRAC